MDPPELSLHWDRLLGRCPQTSGQLGSWHDRLLEGFSSWIPEMSKRCITRGLRSSPSWVVPAKLLSCLSEHTKLMWHETAERSGLVM